MSKELVCRFVSKPDRRHTAVVHSDPSVVLQVSHTSLIQNARGEGVHPTQRALREVVAERVAEPAGAGGIAGAKCIRLAKVVVLGEQPIVRIPVVIHPQRGFVSIKQIADLLKKATQKKSKGLILDLRSNSGGLLNAAVDIAGLFVDKGSLVVTTKDKNNKIVEKYHTKRAPIADGSVPIFILINNYTASAAEILAGVLKIHSQTKIPRFQWLPDREFVRSSESADIYL